MTKTMKKTVLLNSAYYQNLKKDNTLDVIFVSVKGRRYHWLLWNNNLCTYIYHHI